MSPTMKNAGYVSQGMEQLWDPNVLDFEIIYPSEWNGNSIKVPTPQSNFSLYLKGYPALSGVWLCCGCLETRGGDNTANPEAQALCKACDHKACPNCVRISPGRNDIPRRMSENKRAETATSSKAKVPTPPAASPPPSQGKRIHSQTPSRWICSGPRCRATNPGLESLFSAESPDVGELCCSNPYCISTLQDAMKDDTPVWIQNRYFEYLGT
ncbi:hypothetical protein V8F06_004038 [Rhypophila decipiens]